MGKSVVSNKQDKELFAFDSYELAEIVAKFTSTSVLTKEKIYINVAARKGFQHKAFYFLSTEWTNRSEEGFWFAGEFFPVN